MEDRGWSRLWRSVSDAILMRTEALGTMLEAHKRGSATTSAGVECSNTFVVAALRGRWWLIQDAKVGLDAEGTRDGFRLQRDGDQATESARGACSFIK